MRLIVGIGNPGNKYINTRHNIGFNILDLLCQKLNLKFRPTKSNFWLMESKLDTFHFFLMKPATYVNNSGLAVKEFVDEFGIPIEDVLVVYDDTNLDAGVLRIRKSGADGGHNGIKSIIYHLEDDRFNRLRIGVGKPYTNQDLADFVLSNFSEDEFNKINDLTPLIISLIENFITGGIDSMLNFYSRESLRNSSNNPITE